MSVRSFWNYLFFYFFACILLLVADLLITTGEISAIADKNIKYIEVDKIYYAFTIFLFTSLIFFFIYVISQLVMFSLFKKLRNYRTLYTIILIYMILFLSTLTLWILITLPRLNYHKVYFNLTTPSIILLIFDIILSYLSIAYAASTAIGIFQFICNEDISSEFNFKKFKSNNKILSKFQDYDLIDEQKKYFLIGNKKNIKDIIDASIIGEIKRISKQLKIFNFMNNKKTNDKK